MNLKEIMFVIGRRGRSKYFSIPYDDKKVYYKEIYRKKKSFGNSYVKRKFRWILNYYNSVKN